MKPLNFLTKGSYRAAVCLLLAAVPYLTKAQVSQPLLFEDTPILPSALTASQSIVYNKLASSGDFSEIRVIQFNALAAAEQQGNVKVQVVGNVCGEVTFTAACVDYNNENEYAYYGRMMPKEDCECTDGEIIITKTTDGLVGNLRIGNLGYSIFDLGGGKQVIGRIPQGSLAYCGNVLEEAVDNPTGDPTGERSGGACNIRVLFLYTENAAIAFPGSITANINNAVNWANYTLVNSAVYPINAKFIIAGIESTGTHFVETPTMTTHSARVSISGNSWAQGRMAATGADIVVLFENKNNMDPTDDIAGETTLGGRWVAMDYYATYYPLILTHELGHTLMADHQFCPPSPPNTPGCKNTAGFAHAHTFVAKVGCGNNGRKTIMYGQIDAEQIANYSNPAVNFYNIPTGLAGTRDNAAIIRNFGCTAANHSTLFDDAFAVNISGPYSGCPNSYQYFSANIIGNALGTLTYEWRMAIGGVNYGSVISTNSFVTIQMPPNPNQMVSLKLTVTSSLQGTKVATTYIGVSYCGGLKPNKPNGGSDKIVSVNAYPNPSQGNINFEITANSDVKNGMLTIIDQFGKVVLTMQIEEISKASTYNIRDMTDFTTGLYTYQLNFEGEILAGKFSVIR